MNLDAYLERVGYEGTLDTTLETLAGIHRAHLLSIPYENLDIHLGRTLTLDLPQIFDKIVTRRRGGWCYEMNGLFAWVLREIGFAVTMLASDVRPDFVGDGATGDHLILRVDLERPYLADVGFGNGLFEPIPLEVGDYTQRGLNYALLRDGDRWYFRNQPHGGAGFVFTLMPRTYDYFTKRCGELQTLPESGFVQTTVCQRFTPESVVTLRGAVLRTTTPQGDSDETVDNSTSYEQVLNRTFDLHFSEVEISTLWEKVWARHLAWLRENSERH